MLLFVLVLTTSCGWIFDAPSFVVTAQEDGTTEDAPVAAPTPAEECTLDCANGSVCKLGENDFGFHPKESNGATFTFLQTTSREGWYCECPEGFTGLRCNRKYEVCPLVQDAFSSRNEDGTPHYDAHFCYHGGSCLEGLTDGNHDSIKDSQRFCDCQNAEHNGTPYYGKYCEIEGAVQCSEDSDEYCTAQGTCKEDFAGKFTPCNCRVGHRGPHCEFMRDSVPECSLPCGGPTADEDGTSETPKLGGVGQCRLGIKEFENARYEDFWSGHDGNYQYCACPEGWFGENCEIPGVECGNAHCFNGGSCLESLNKNGQKTYACDCRDAAHLGLNWAGQYCENSETSNCNSGADGSLQHANGHLFCTNGGTCKDPKNPHLGCNCPKDQFGPSCEFHKEEDAECNLQCQNDGECRAGLKDNSLMKKLGKGFEGLGLNETHHSEMFEHCVCPHNYFGIMCEHKLEICPGGGHVCLHGSQCIAKNEGGSTGELHYTCDCDTAFDSLEKYAGKFCQYSSTDICTKNGQPGMGKANFAFCVNNGLCKALVNDGEDPPGCICPDGFYGAHCEYLEKEEDDDGEIGYADDGIYNDDYQMPGTTSAIQTNKFLLRRKGIITGLSAAVIVMVLIFIAFVVRALMRAGAPSDKAADVQAALSEEENSANTSGIIHSSSGDGSLEDIEVDDYVNTHPTMVTDREMTNVQIV